jgi:hypothetical protein
MDFSSILDSIFSYAQENPLNLLGLAMCLLFLFYRKPKLFFGTLFLGLVLAGVFYLIMNLAGMGSEGKRGLLSQEEKQTDSNR